MPKCGPILHLQRWLRHRIGSPAEDTASSPGIPRRPTTIHILETWEAGVVLTGTEVKSLRAGKASIKEAYGRVSGTARCSWTDSTSRRTPRGTTTITTRCARASCSSTARRSSG